jgi:AdoMet-dependent heme synthase
MATVPDAALELQVSIKNASAATSHLRPLQVTWETTRFCEWKATPARLARRRKDKEELSTAEAFHLIQQVAAMRVPVLALTGGDPLSRHDLYPIIEFAARRSVRTSLTLMPTALLTAETIADLKSCGLMRAAFWLHGSNAELHDSYTDTKGSHRRTLASIGPCHEAGLPVQINTLMSRRNFHDLDPMIELLTRLDVILWNVVFLVPTNDQREGELLSAEQHEAVFAKLYAASKQVEFQIKTSEAPQYQRYVLQQKMRESGGDGASAEFVPRSPKNLNDGKGFIFVNYRGEVFPSRYLPIAAGNLKEESLVELFRESSLFASLRDSSKLKGKCGVCRVRHVCGGSRARAYAISGDVFGEDPCCSHPI